MHRRFLHASRLPSANSCHGSRHHGTSMWHDARRESRLRNRTTLLSSPGGSTTRNAWGLPHSKTQVPLHLKLVSGSRKARMGRVLAGKSWPHLLSGDMKLSAKKVSSIRWPYKISQAGVSLKV